MERDVYPIDIQFLALYDMNVTVSFISVFTSEINIQLQK